MYGLGVSDGLGVGSGLGVMGATGRRLAGGSVFKDAAFNSPASKGPLDASRCDPRDGVVDGLPRINPASARCSPGYLVESNRVRLSVRNCSRRSTALVSKPVCCLLEIDVPEARPPTSPERAIIGCFPFAFASTIVPAASACISGSPK
ncbi:hypothetical protein HBH53_225670 [Parastagonospora nodorum]|nr:hypothetical protein HBH53_225670 [Parastagonospora nodorum]KAH5983142.1 hypothetical protein HBI82_234230 [Parastagonospora nodorum]